MKLLTPISPEQAMELTDTNPESWASGFAACAALIEKINAFDPEQDEKLDGFEQMIKNNGLVPIK